MPHHDDDLKRQFDEEATRVEVPEIDARAIARRAARRRRVRATSQVLGLAGVLVGVLVLTNVIRNDPGSVELVQPAGPNGSVPATPGVSSSPSSKASPRTSPSSPDPKTPDPERRSEPAISSDGRFVAYTAGRVFVVDRKTGKREVASISDTGAVVEGFGPQISSDGRFVAFVARSGVVYRRDRVKGITRAVSVSATGAPVNAGSQEQTISMSGDGRYIAFSTTKILVEGDSNGVEDIVVRDMGERTTTRVSVASSGEEANGRSVYGDLSSSGRLVAFQSYASNLHTGTQPSCDGICPQVYVHDRETGETVLASVASAGEVADKGGRHPSLSADGNVVAFDSASTNLGSSASDGVAHDIFVHDRRSGETREISGSHELCNCVFPQLSSNGGLVVFGTGSLGIRLYDISAGSERRIGSFGGAVVGFAEEPGLVVFADAQRRIVLFSAASHTREVLP